MMPSIKNPMLTLFYMDTCPHCVALKPTWVLVKKTLHVHNIPCGEFEYRQMGSLPPSLQNISGFPTIQIVKENVVVAEYHGDRSHESIVQFAMSHIPHDTPQRPAKKPRLSSASSGTKPKPKPKPKPKAKKPVKK